MSTILVSIQRPPKMKSIKQCPPPPPTHTPSDRLRHSKVRLDKPNKRYFSLLTPTLQSHIRKSANERPLAPVVIWVKQQNEAPSPILTNRINNNPFLQDMIYTANKKEATKAIRNRNIQFMDTLTPSENRLFPERTE